MTKKTRSIRCGIVVSMVAALSFTMTPVSLAENTSDSGVPAVEEESAYIEPGDDSGTYREDDSSAVDERSDVPEHEEDNNDASSGVRDVEEPSSESPVANELAVPVEPEYSESSEVEEPADEDHASQKDPRITVTRIGEADEDGWVKHQLTLRDAYGAVGLVHRGVHIDTEELVAVTESGAYVSADIMDLEDDGQVLLLQLEDDLTEGVTVTYFTGGDDSADAWEITDATPFIEDSASEEIAPRSSAFRATATRGVSPNTNQRGAVAVQSDTYIRDNGYNSGTHTEGMATRRYTGPLNDPDFGANYPQIGNYTASSNPQQRYPIRHRNWAMDNYRGGGTGREIRGPSRMQTEPGARSEGMVYRYGEQGLYYSRDHVQYAWREQGGNGDVTMRASEFLMGGGDPDSVFYSALYKTPGTLTTPVLRMQANYKGTGKPSVRLFIEDVLNTEEPGWVAQQGNVSQNEAIYLISPDGKLGVMLDRNAQNELMIRFYDNERMKRLRGRQTVFQYINTVGKIHEFPIVGIRVPGWKRTVISYGTQNEPRSGADAEPISQMRKVQQVNGYRTAGFIPNWGRDAQAPLTIDKTVQNAPAVGRNYVDYQIKVSNTHTANARAVDRTFRVMDKPQFTNAVNINRVVRREPNGTETTLSRTDDGYEVASGTIRAGATQTHTIRVYFTPGQGSNALTCQGAGSGTFNHVDLYLTGSTTPTDSDSACAPIPVAPDLEFLKTNASSAPVEGNDDQMWATYDLIVSNPRNGVARTYRDLLDTPSFVAGATIREVKASSAQQAVLTTPVQAGQSWRITRENTTISIAPGTRHVYQVRMRVDKVPVDGTDSRLRCSPGADRHGLLNKAQVRQGDRTLTGEACVDAQPQPSHPSISKTVSGAVTELEDAKAQVHYTVTVRNNFPAAIARTITVTDRPQFGSIVGLPSTVEVLRPGSQTWQQLPRRGGGYTLDSSRNISAGQTLEYRVRVTFRMPKPGASETQLQCSTTGNGAGSGLFNKATLDYGSGTTEDHDCTDIPPSFEQSQVEKVVGDVSPLAGQPGYSTVNYTIRAIVPENGKQSIVDIIDEPRFGGVTIEKFEVFRGGQWATLTPNNGRYVLGRAVDLPPDSIEEYEVRVTVKNAPSSASESELACSTEPGRGLYNTVHMTWDTGSAQDDACAPAPQDDPLAELMVEKTDTDRAPLPRESGWKFQLYYLGADGKQQGELVSEMDAAAPGRRSAVTSGKVLRAGRYQLVETQAPDGYQLLPTAVNLQVAFSDRKPQITILNQANFPGVHVSGPGVSGNEAWIIQVADIRDGELPLTGGRGIWMFLVPAVALLGLALFLRRR